MSGSDDLGGMRHDYEAPSFEETTLAPDPVRQFRHWFDDAVRAGVIEPNAMVLATVDASGRPRQRTVLLKGFDQNGFTFFTNYESDKAHAIADNPSVCLLFGWYRLHRQVIITGQAHRIPRAETEHYFARRPRGSQLAAWASPQSRRIAGRAELDASYAAAEHRFGDQDDVPPPPHWGGFQVRPTEVEFWQGRANRLHDRLRYVYPGSGAWVVERLAP